VTGPVAGGPAWPAIAALLGRELGGPIRAAYPLTPWRGSQTWAARTDSTGDLVVKARYGDDAYAKTAWTAAHLPLLGARGYPVPTIVWHGMLDEQWHVTVQDRLPGRPLTSLSPALLDAVMRLVELQADAGIPAGDRHFTGYVAHVLFDDWDDVWVDAARSCAAAGELCARLRHWLQPVWGLRLLPADFATNDLNLSNVLSDGVQITGVVDWDEFGLGSRALDLVALAFDCAQLGDWAAVDRLLGRAGSIVGAAGLRCLVSYRAIAYLASGFEGYDLDPHVVAVTFAAVLDRLRASDRQLA
jgi:aminoglycoside phosphotransferase (APT) family kinase protein